MSFKFKFNTHMEYDGKNMYNFFIFLWTFLVHIHGEAMCTGYISIKGTYPGERIICISPLRTHELTKFIKKFKKIILSSFYSTSSMYKI
jgi:hypothetical protein